MSGFRLDLFDRRFDDLVASARARIPNLAPDWTDHNLHDPGITLIELLAWTAEAQIYALSRMRKDERIAYGALLGIVPHGPLAAAGEVWPRAPVTQWQVVARDAEAGTGKPDAPLFWPAADIALVPVAVTALRTRLADGAQLDRLDANARNGASYEPFGPHGCPGDVLELSLRCDGGMQLPAQARSGAARMSLGVRVASGLAVAAGPVPALRVTLAGAGVRLVLPVEDGTAGFSRNGVLLLDLSGLAPHPALSEFTLYIHAPRGFAVAPRIRSIEPNVLPLLQARIVKQEVHIATGQPGQELKLGWPGLQFGAGAPEVVVESRADGEALGWQRTSDLAASRPADLHYLLDESSGRIWFGNGINGKLLHAGDQIWLSYSASAGAQGNLPRSQAWSVTALGARFGENLDPMSGGADALDLAGLRSAARRRVREQRPLVTAADVRAAASALQDLQVARAELLQRPACCGQAQAAVLTLVALRARQPGEAGAEDARWLEALRARLAPRLPLGTRLRVIAPRYLRLRVRARLLAQPMASPALILEQAQAELLRRLAPVAARAGDEIFPLGAALSAMTVAAWLRGIAGVARVTECQLSLGEGDDAPAGSRVTLPPSGLPRLDLAASDIALLRAGSLP